MGGEPESAEYGDALKRSGFVFVAQIGGPGRSARERSCGLHPRFVPGDPPAFKRGRAACRDAPHGLGFGVARAGVYVCLGLACRELRFGAHVARRLMVEP